MLRFLSALLAVLLLAAPRAYAQPYALRADVVSGGATEASGGAYALRATLGQPAVGRVSGGPYALDQGFWPLAVPAADPPTPDLTITMVPVNPPIVIPPGGGSFRFRVAITNHTDQVQTFQAWTTGTYPGGNTILTLGPQTLTLQPGATFGPFRVRQRVAGFEPPGEYVYTGLVGTYPTPVIDADSFTFTKAAGGAFAMRSGASVRTAPAPATRDASTPGEAARDGAPSTAAGAAGVNAGAASAARARRGRPARLARGSSPDGWAVFADATGEELVGPDALAGLARRLGAAEGEGAAPEEPATRVGRDEGAGAAAPAGWADGGHLPEVTALHPAYPNPLGRSTTVPYDVAEAVPVRLAVYDALGREVARLVDATLPPGRYLAPFDAAGLPSGTYLVRMTAGGGFARAQRLTLLR